MGRSQLSGRAVCRSEVQIHALLQSFSAGLVIAIKNAHLPTFFQHPVKWYNVHLILCISCLNRMLRQNAKEVHGGPASKACSEMLSKRKEKCLSQRSRVCD